LLLFWPQLYAITIRKRSLDMTTSLKGHNSGMASKRQIKANQANATKSTGPKTIAGKARSSRNAFRHGLSRWDEGDDLRTQTLSLTLAAEFAGELVARDLARAKARLTEIRAIRLKLLLTMTRQAKPQQMKSISGLGRYEKAAWAQVRRALKRVERKVP